MLNKKGVKKILLALLPVLFCVQALAQNQFSYVYIQGDKQTPFYVKLEDQMQPRYGKDYSIISQLAPGIINIEILFQQNAYPTQKFTIKVPENGYRGFLLTHRNDAFALYDIQQQFYLPAGNKAEDDHAPANIPNYVNTEDAAVTNDAGNAKEPDEKKDTVVKKSNEPQFIENIELNNEKTILNDKLDNDNDLSNNKSAKYKNSIPNSDCPEPVSNEDFTDIYERMLKHGDKTRLKYLLDKLDRCYTTAQIRVLTKGLGNDPERYQFLKQAYPRVTDQSNFPLLESLLSTQEWKGYFLLIMQ
jgi:hypothetical protein